MSILRSCLNSKSLAALTLTLTAITPLISAKADCDKPVDPVKATIFIDTNFGLTEIQNAERAACDRGETFIRLPGELPGEKEAHAALVRQTIAKSSLDNIEKQLKRMGCAVPTQAAEEAELIAPDANMVMAPVEDAENDAVTGCAEVQAKYIRAFRIHDTTSIPVDSFVEKMKAANGGKDFVWNMVRKGFIELAQKGIRPSALVISGHSSGNAFGGRYGGIMFNSLQKHILAAYAEKPELLSDFRSMYLWGCNTLNPYEPEKWVKTFPSIEMIVGFQGSAPSNLNASSWTILDGLMHLERTIVAKLPEVKDPEEIRKALSKVQGISGSVAAVYLHDIANERGWFYERVQEMTSTTKVATWVSRVRELKSAKECQPLEEQIKKDQTYIDSILSGETKISEETGSGALRDVFTRSHGSDICRAALGLKHSSQQIGFLLFWHGVKKNAMRMMEGETAILSKELSKWITDRATIEMLITTSNEEVKSGKATRNAVLEKQRKDALKIIGQLNARLSNIAAGEALLPFTKERQKEMKELLREEKLRMKAVAKGEDVKEALATTRSSLAHYREAMKIVGLNDLTIGQKATTLDVLKTDATSVNANLSNWEKHLVKLDAQILKSGGAYQVLNPTEVMDQLIAFQASLTPKSVSEIDPLSYPEVLKKHQARVEALANIERAITSSPGLMKNLAYLLTVAKTWNEHFQKTVIYSDTKCMELLPWHEYIPGQPASDRPIFNCHQ